MTTKTILLGRRDRTNHGEAEFEQTVNRLRLVCPGLTFDSLFFAGAVRVTGPAEQIDAFGALTPRDWEVVDLEGGTLLANLKIVSKE